MVIGNIYEQRFCENMKFLHFYFTFSKQNNLEEMLWLVDFWFLTKILLYLRPERGRRVVQRSPQNKTTILFKLHCKYLKQLQVCSYILTKPEILSSPLLEIIYVTLCIHNILNMRFSP